MRNVSAQTVSAYSSEHQPVNSQETLEERETDRLKFKYSAFRQNCEKLWTSLALSILKPIEHNKTELLSKMFFMLEFEKDGSRTLRFSTNRKNPILDANGVVGYYRVVTERHKSIFPTGVAKRSWCAGPIVDHTLHSLRRFSFFYFQVVAKKADGAQAEIVERFSRQAADEFTLVLVEKSAEFSCVASQKLDHFAPADQK